MVIIKRMQFFFEFMLYAREVTTNILETGGELVATFWEIFSYVLKDAQVYRHCYLLVKLKSVWVS